MAERNPVEKLHRVAVRYLSPDDGLARCTSSNVVEVFWRCLGSAKIPL